MRVPLSVAIVVWSAVTATSASASPTIQVAQPPITQPLYNVQPLIQINYSANGGPPLNLTTFQVLANGADWTSRFTVGASSASYQVANPDHLVAGSFTLAASIRNQSGAPASINVTYQVYPTVQTLAPTEGAQGTTVTVTALGLDPNPVSNALGFTAYDGSTPLTPFSTVDAAAGHGEVVVPEGSATGPVKLSVNGKAATATPTFTVRQPFVRCGDVQDMRFLSDGSLLVSYHYYHAMDGDPERVHTDPACPFITPNIGARTVVLHEFPNGTATIVIDRQPHQVGTNGGSETVAGLAVDKSGAKFAILTEEDIPGDQPINLRRIYYGSGSIPGLDPPTSVPGFTITKFIWVSLYGGIAYPQYFGDFDFAGNLMFPAFENTPPPWSVKIYRITAAVLATGGNTTLQVMLTVPIPAGWQYAYTTSFQVACGGPAVLGLERGDGGNTFGSVVWRLDLQTGTVVREELFPRFAFGSGTCEPDTLIGTSLLYDGSTYPIEIWRFHGEESRETLVTLPNNGVSLGTFALASDGAVHVSDSWSIVRVPSLMDQCGGPTAQPFPCPELSILPTTTRWKPERGVEPVEVHFHSPYALASATLKVVGPAGALTLDPAPVLEPTTEPPPNDAPFTYKLVWQGPWTTTVNGQPGPLPRGNYTATVTGVRTDGQGSVWSAPYDKISLVEVTQTELVAIPGEATLDDNPAVGTLPGQTPPQSRPGGGKRIFAESTSAGGPILNRVQVVATIDPPIPADAQFPPAQTTVRVHFASYDVDDPAPYAPDKDNDTGDVADNRGTPANGSASPDYFDIQPGQTEASTNFTVSGQPGDNYRVAASTSQDWLLGLKAVQPSTTGEMTVPTEAPGPVSEMLTVWRTLNVELESMAAPPPPTTLPGSPAYLERNFIRGRVLRVRRNEAGVPVYMDLEPEVTPPPPPPQPPPPVLTVRDRSLGFEEGANGRFEHGSIRVGIEATGILLTNLDGNGVKLPEDYDYVRKVGPTPPTTIALQARLVTAQGTSPIRPWVLEWDASTRQFLLNMNVSTIYVGGQFSLGGVNWTIASVSGATVTVQQEQPDKPLPFFLADDDAASYPFLPNQSLLQASDDPLQNPLAQAYVRPKYFPTGPKVPPFNRNINCLGPGPPPTPCDVTEFVQQLAAGRDIPPSTPGFWASYVQGASQGDEAYGDLDPQSEWPVSDIGSTLGQGDAYGSFAYSDSTRDWLVQEQEPDQLDHCSSRVLVHELGHQFGLDHGSHGIMPYASCLSNENYFEASDIETIREKKGLIP